MTEQERPDSWWPRDPDREPDQDVPGAPAPGATPTPSAPGAGTPDAADPTRPGWAQPSSPARSGQWVPDYGQGATAGPPPAPAGAWGPPAASPHGAPGAPTWSPGPYGAGGWTRPQNEPMAVAALVVGIFSLLCGLAGCLGIVLGPVAIGLSVAARRRIATSGGLLGGSGLATAGLVCGIVGLVVSVGWLVYLLANPDFVQELQNQLTTTTTTR